MCEGVNDAGFAVINVEDYREIGHHQSEEELMNLVEMVPLVGNFDSEKDRGRMEALSEKYRDQRGIKTTWHYFILKARKQSKRAGQSHYDLGSTSQDCV